MKSGIYKILCLDTDKFYIGSAKNLHKRFYEHKRQLNKNQHPNRYLQFSWNKYLENKFVFVVVEYCEANKLIEREQHYIDTLKPEYNLTPKANSMLGFKHSDETKKKISQAAKNISEETRAKMKAHIFSEEHKRKMSIARRKRIITPETRRKLSEAGFKNKKPIILTEPPIIVG